MSRKITDLKTVYLIYGSEELRLEQALGRLKNSVAAVADLDFNMDTFDGENADVDQIISAANTLPFASERRLVVVRNTDKLNKDALEALASYAADPSPTTVLVLVAVKLAKNTRLFKAVDALGGTHEYAAPRKSEYPAEVRAMAEARGKRMARDASELLVSSVGFDLRRLAAELDKTIAFVGERSAITLSDVEQLVITTAPTSVFEFLDALADRDCERSLRLLAMLVGEGESVLGLNALVLRRLRDLIAFDSLDSRGTPLAAIAREIGRQEWQLKRMPRQVRAFRSGELVDLLRYAAESEAKMKTSRDSRLVFERFIMRICGA